MDLIWVGCEAEYFCNWDWTGQIRLIRFKKLSFTQNSGRSPAASVASVARMSAAKSGVGVALAPGCRFAHPGVLRLEPDVFRPVTDGIMLAAGLSTLWTAATT
jgi:hypothetical protein